MTEEPNGKLLTDEEIRQARDSVVFTERWTQTELVTARNKAIAKAQDAKSRRELVEWLEREKLLIHLEVVAAEYRVAVGCLPQCKACALRREVGE